MAFPLSPTDGQRYTTSSGTVYEYSTSLSAWSIVSEEITGSQGETGAPGVYNLYESQDSFGLTGANPGDLIQYNTSTSKWETSSYALGVVDEGSASTGPIEINWSSNSFKKSVSIGVSGTTFYMTNALTGANMTLAVSYEANEVPGFTGVKWADGTAPIMSGQTGLVDLSNFYYDGNSYYGQVSTGFDYE